MTRRPFELEEPEDAPGSILFDQRMSILAAFEQAGTRLRADQGQAITAALAARGHEWLYGSDLGWLSRHQAGIVLEALHDRGRVPDGR
jgi:hypothetical protein